MARRHVCKENSQFCMKINILSVNKQGEKGSIQTLNHIEHDF